MNVSTDLAALAEHVERLGDAVYVVTADDRATAHVVSSTLHWDGDTLVAAAGRRTSSNIEASGAVTLLWPAPPGQPYSLIVDGDARVGPEEGTIAVRPTRAVLHRVARADPALPSCVKLLEA